MTGIIILQIFLSKRQNKWLGLILPIINVIFSIRAVLGINFDGGESISTIVMETIMTFLVWNILTGVLSDIYFTCREKFKKSKI
ncbi:hypothetical protein [Clostridium sp. CM028]|uniref:hypothetical protein n=1 Tax=Clostridium sp. CM028 TaxID=2851575 RepID=UPI002162B8CD|nr:hypothetical protein [Clostridium sp. CM028]